jgi:hypothetical protein
MGEFTPEETKTRQREFMRGDAEEPRFVVRKYEGKWYGVDNSIPVNSRLDVPGQGHLLKIDEDNAEIERLDTPMDVVEYMDDELNTTPVSEAPKEFRDRMDDLK